MNINKIKKEFFNNLEKFDHDLMSPDELFDSLLPHITKTQSGLPKAVKITKKQMDRIDEMLTKEDIEYVAEDSWNYAGHKKTQSIEKEVDRQVSALQTKACMEVLETINDINESKIKYPDGEEYSKGEVDSHVDNYELGWVSHRLKVRKILEQYKSSLALETKQKETKE